MATKRAPKDWLALFKSVHGDAYDYSKAVFNGASDPIEIYCNAHQRPFSQSPFTHAKGCGCVLCGREKNRQNMLARRKSGWKPDQSHWKSKYGKAYWARALRSKHGDFYVWEVPEDCTQNTQLLGVCPFHGDFSVEARHAVAGHGCQKCGWSRVNGDRQLTFPRFLEELPPSLRGYAWLENTFSMARGTVSLQCPKHGMQTVAVSKVRELGCGCPACGRESVAEKTKLGMARAAADGAAFGGYRNANAPLWEVELLRWLHSLGFTDAYLHDRSVLGKELDVYIPSKKVGVELNGLFWHSTKSPAKGKDYVNWHYGKRLRAEAKGVRLIQFWDSEWRDRRDICKEILAFALGKISERLYARKLQIRHLGSQECNVFLEDNHIQGATRCNVRLGLFDGDRLVGVQCYEAPRPGRGYWVVTRTCFLKGVQVLGGISKLFKHFRLTRFPSEVRDLTDLRLFRASGHYAMGFKRLKDTPPNHYYTDGHNVYHRRRFNTKKFRADHGWANTKHMAERMLGIGYGQVWDAGKAVNVWVST